MVYFNTMVRGGHPIFHKGQGQRVNTENLYFKTLVRGYVCLSSCNGCVFHILYFPIGYKSAITVYISPVSFWPQDGSQNKNLWGPWLDDNVLDLYIKSKLNQICMEMRHFKNKSFKGLSEILFDIGKGGWKIPCVI